MLYDENHPEVASVLNTLAIILEEQGMDEEARNMLRRVVEIRRQQPEADTNLAANLNNLATMLLRSDSYGEAEEMRSEEHTSELQSRGHLVCRLLLEKKKTQQK